MSANQSNNGKHFQACPVRSDNPVPGESILSDSEIAGLALQGLGPVIPQSLPPALTSEELEAKAEQLSAAEPQAGTS